MTFGQTLKQMLSISGVKLTHLANGLGYDSSYISRWINEVKLPSLKNNDNLFYKIADTIIDYSSPNACAQLRQQYCVSAEDELRDILAGLLQESYSDPNQDEPIAPFIGRNASYFSGIDWVDSSYRAFKDAFHTAARDGNKDMVECICGAPLSLNGNTHGGFFSAVLPDKEDKDQFRIMIHQLIDMQDFDRNVDLCCAAICTFTRYNQDVLYTFYEYDVADSCCTCLESYMLIESSMMQLSYKNPLTHKTDTIISFDSASLSNDFTCLKMELAFLPKILKFCSLEDMNDNYSFLYNYIMNGNIRYFMDFMQPVYMPSEMFEQLSKKYMGNVEVDSFLTQYNNICANVPKEVILYSSTLLNYVYNGEIFLSGRIVTLNTQERIDHLEQLIAKIESGSIRILILSDTNPLLNREDTKLSFFLSRKSGFLVPVGDRETPLIRIRSVRTVEYFNQFFTHMKDLDSNYISTGEHAADFIRSGINILRINLQNSAT